MEIEKHSGCIWFPSQKKLLKLSSEYIQNRPQIRIVDNISRKHIISFHFIMGSY